MDTELSWPRIVDESQPFQEIKTSPKNGTKKKMLYVKPFEEDPEEEDQHVHTGRINPSSKRRRQHSVDVLLLLGLLHHTQRKTDNLPRLAALLRSDGWLVLHEAIQKFPWSYRPPLDASAHEERIDPRSLEREIQSLSPQFSVEYRRELMSLFLWAAVKRTTRLLPRRRRFLIVTSYVDFWVCKVLGAFLTVAKRGEILFLLRRHPDSRGQPTSV